jgi:uncharacterized protein YbjT (DUF2867 family)
MDRLPASVLSDAMATTTSSHPVLVTGGTGKTGRRVAARLEALGTPARIGSRSADVPFDWDDDATWGPALRGVGAVFIAYAPDLAFPGAAETVDAFSRRAVGAGAQRLVLLSGRGEEGAERAERFVQEAGAAWTVVRCAVFAQNFDEGLLVDAVRAGELALPAGDVREPIVDADDIADVVVAALTDDAHAGRLYELTGPRLLSFQEAMDEIGRAVGRSLRYRPVSAGEFADQLRAAGLPDAEADGLAWLFTEIFDGRNGSVGDGVQRALGREPRDFADYVRRTAATGAWSPQPVAGA